MHGGNRRTDDGGMIKIVSTAECGGINSPASENANVGRIK
jgi:hypothetical protein